MGKLKHTTYGIHDVAITPAAISNIDSRSQCNPLIDICGRKSYPIFVAPMAAVTDERNYKVFINNKVTPVIPRSVMGNLTIEERLDLAKETFVSFSMSEAEEIGKIDFGDNEKRYICIDLANGHMKSLHNLCRSLKKYYGGQIEIMTGNIANPEVYRYLCDAGIDWCRCNIGTGNRCVTSNTTGTAYGSATLIDEINDIREQLRYDGFFAYDNTNTCRVETKIIYDGGINWFDDINKAIALGADSVMIGKMFAECNEACGKVLYSESEEYFKLGIGYHLDELYTLSEEKKDRLTPFRDYAGMSHRSMQKITGGDGSKVSEGIVKPVVVKYSLSHFMELVDAYIRSAMSYSDAIDIPTFRVKAKLNIMGGTGLSVYKK